MEKEEKRLFYNGARLEIVDFSDRDIITTSPNETDGPFDSAGDMDDAWT